MNYTIKLTVPLTQDEAEDFSCFKGDSWSYGWGDAGFMFQSMSDEWEDCVIETYGIYEDYVINDNMDLTLLL